MSRVWHMPLTAVGVLLFLHRRHHHHRHHPYRHEAKAREMKGLSTITQPRLVANKGSHTSGFFHFITLRQHCCLDLTFYSTSWKTLDIIWLFHVSKLEVQPDIQETSAQKQTVRVKTLKPNNGSPGQCSPIPEPGILKETRNGAGAGPENSPSAVGTELPGSMTGLLLRKLKPKGRFRRTVKGADILIPVTFIGHLLCTRHH